MPSIILEPGSGQDELRVYLRDKPRTGAWQGTDDVRKLTQPDGTVTGLSIRDYRKHAHNRLVLVDLIARNLSAHRDDVIEAVARLTF